MFVQYRVVLLKLYALMLVLIAASFAVQAQSTPEQLYPPIPDDLRPSSAQAGTFPVGVRTVELVHSNQLDLNTQQRAARKLTVELWYPANGMHHNTATTYPSMTKSHQPFVIQGSAYRHAELATATKLPVVVLSHGYPGNRTLMFYLAEHLASHGYLVAAVDHPHSTYGEIDQKNAPYQGFLNTLYHRSRDQQFVLQTLREHAHPDLLFLKDHIDGHSAAVIGYSMGGYGALNTIGGCYAFTAQHITAFTGVKEGAANQALQQTLNSCAGGQTPATVKVDPAWKAAIAIAPWGGQHQLFSKSALQQLAVPVMFWAGDQDEVSGYQGMRSLYEMAGSKQKYFLTYQHAGHNIAPHPAPAVSRTLASDFAHYHEASWASDTINNINRHFALLMLDCHVKAISAQCEQLKIQAPSALWPGYRKGLPTGLRWMSATAH